jgi:hypothetical protein
MDAHVRTESQIHLLAKTLKLTPTASDERHLYYDGPSPPANWKAKHYKPIDEGSTEENTPYDGATLLKLARWKAKNGKKESTQGQPIVPLFQLCVAGV